MTLHSAHLRFTEALHSLQFSLRGLEPEKGEFSDACLSMI
jgi:hypothetical protein